MATTNSFHHLNDGRGQRAVYVNGNPISRVVWCDTARGLAVFCPFPVRINRRTGKVYNRLLLYCFDLMRNDIPGGLYLKTFNEAGEITFNSLQAPLNVIASMGAPAPTGTDRYGRRYGYAGGRWELVRRQTANVDSQAHHLIDIPLSAGVEYAACLPWSRAANAFLGNALTGVDGIVYGMSEGAVYEIVNIPSATVLSIRSAYNGASANGAPYAITPAQTHVKDLADQIRLMLTQWGTAVANLGAVSTENVVPVTKGGTGGHIGLPE